MNNEYSKELFHSAIENDSYLEHHGVLGMKWGVRRYQNKDGSLTSAGKRRYGTSDASPESIAKGKNKHIQRRLNDLEESITTERSNYTKANKYQEIATKKSNALASKGKDKKAMKWAEYALSQRQKRDDAEKRIKEYESEQWKLIGNAAVKGKDIKISDAFLDSSRIRRLAANLGGVVGSLMNMSISKMQGTGHVGNKFKVRNAKNPDELGRGRLGIKKSAIVRLGENSKVLGTNS